MALTETSLLPYFNATANNHRQDSRAAERSEKDAEKRVNATMQAQQVNTREDAEIIAEVLNLFYTARAHRKPLVSKWNKSYKMLRGRYWSENARQSWLPSPSPPEIFPIIRSLVGWMTDRRFHNTVSVAAAPFSSNSQFYNQLAKDLETVLDATWHVNQEEGEVTIGLWDAFTYGTAIFKTCWDNSLAGGMGDAKISRVDPFGFYPDPTARNTFDGNYFIEVKNMSLQELDRRFPGAYKKFGGIGNRIEEFDRAPDPIRGTGNVPYSNPMSLNGTTVAKYGPPGGSRANRGLIEDEGVTVFECWVREHEHYVVDTIDPERGKVKEKHTFDTWRVYVVAGEHLLLNARADEIWEHGQHPYSRFVPHDLGEFWGVGQVELLTSSQEAINRLLASAIQNIELTGNPILMEDHRANISRTQIVNKPGQRIAKGAGDAKWMEPPKIQTDIPMFLNYFLARMETISGLSAITKGQNPSGRPAEGTMDAVQEASFVGIRMALRSLEYTLRDAGYKKSSLIVENYTIPRIVAITGESGMRSTLGLRGGHFMVESGQSKVPMQYQLLVDAGAGTDTSRKVREDKAITLFTLGALDVYSLLEALQIPNRDEVYQRVLSQAQSGMFAQPGKRERARA